MFKLKRKKRDQESEKIFLMWAGVCFFMILITSLWFLNMKNIFSNIKVAEGDEQTDINKITENFYQSIDQIKERFDEVNTTVESIKEEKIE